jgi:hypothetical protein
VNEQIRDGKYSVVMDDCILVDSYLKVRPQDYYAKFRGKNAFLVHLLDENYDGGYQHYDNFRAVFRHDYSDIFNPKRVLQLPLGYTEGVKPGKWEYGTSKRPYVWSFLGGAAKSSRPEMIKAFLRFTPHLAHITDTGVKVPWVNKLEYAEILRNSIFAPSAMGNVNVECYRMYEALECGSIPILERRIGWDYYQGLLGDHPLPTFLTWGQAARWVEKILPDTAALDDLQKRCVAWWQNHKLKLNGQIRAMLDSPGTAADGPYVHWKYGIPGWQIAELLHHHTVPAVARRIKTQTLRLAKEGKLRKNTGALK